MKNLENSLKSLLEERYHHKHPFNIRMHKGTLTKEEMKTWVRNRYYYQTRIPKKDSSILTKSDDPDFRRDWVWRVRDHDGDEKNTGGLELWLRLGDGVGLNRAEVSSLTNVLPGVRRACDAYIEFVNGHSLLESVAASLTELSAGPLMGQRITAFENHYTWIEPSALDYFRSRTSQAPRDAQEGLEFVLGNAKTDKDHVACLAALTRKCEILWELLDGVEWAQSRPKIVDRARMRKNELMIVLPERAIELNSTGMEILEACKGEATVNKIAEAMMNRHNTIETVFTDTYEFLEKMKSAGALEYI